MRQKKQFDTAPREFHVARAARDRYAFGDELFAARGTAILANFHAARVFASQMNARRDLVRFPEQAVRAAHINSMGLIDEVMHHIVALYRQQQNPALWSQALAQLEAALGTDSLNQTLTRFVDQFPTVAVYRNALPAAEYLAGSTEGTPNREIVLEELLMLWLENANPAFAPYGELFDDGDLEKATAYPPLMAELQRFLGTQPGFGTGSTTLIDLLRAPALAAPHSLSAQLEYIRTRWGGFAGGYLYRVLSGLDFIREEEKPVFFGPGPALVPTYEELKGVEEVDRFSADKAWMPRVILLAKNTYVWLDQLSRQYEKPITRLDHIPDEELDLLAARGITGLWLIGLWERSKASQRIKQMCGNPDAVASAYSVHDYDIAGDLGGDDAMNDLRHRAWQRGIRMASDMVPNHMAIDARWVAQHPDWFVTLDHSPFPTYTFDGPDLSWDDRVGIFLEDHYFSRTDAAVVFKRLDRHTGSVSYVYHGNDGTTMPWNDTAQLDYLNPEAREAVIQTILHVARQFPIIRFDAAMTLAKKHYQRLWYPQPGHGGAIPSRAEHGITTGQFNDAMPEEFWREVVDRVATEVPETLLLAEAFWMMEGYFVRTLGMHRVYNSAFMNMLRDEENVNYRQVLKNTLEFDPDILKRFVNFMNNPDERTAIDQFGDGDKYFGVCTLMATLPGLPMLGHGQIEGFAEKYGMEYRRAVWDETPKDYLVARHERQIFPLLHLRPLFAEVQNFLLYDFWTPEGAVNEDVFAYSNRLDDQSALVIYHNRYADARGWIRASVGFMEKDGAQTIIQRNLADGLELRDEPELYTIFRDHVSGLEYIRASHELCERGLYVELGAYDCRVYMDFREVEDDAAHHYAHLTAYLDGRGVPSIADALVEVLLQPVHQPFLELANAALWEKLLDGDDKALDAIETRAAALLDAIHTFTADEAVTYDSAPSAASMRARFAGILELPLLSRHVPSRDSNGAVREEQHQAEPTPTSEDRPTAEPTATIEPAQQEPTTDPRPTWAVLIGWATVKDLGKTIGPDPTGEQSRSWLDEWHLGRLLCGTLRDFGLDERAADYAVTAIKVLTVHGAWLAASNSDLEALIRDREVQRLLQINRHGGVLWYNKEAFEQLLYWLSLTARVLAPSASTTEFDAKVVALTAASEAADYRVEKLLEQH